MLVGITGLLGGVTGGGPAGIAVPPGVVGSLPSLGSLALGVE